MIKMIRYVSFIFFITTALASIPENGPLQPVSLKNIGPRIINGDTATLGQFPWQVGILGQNSLGGFFCGGSLIGNEWVLTAAHCLYGTISAAIYSGTTKISDRNKIISYASKFILHEKYNPNNYNHDIGLIKLRTPITFNENIKPIALAIKDPKTGSNLTVSGWGVTSDGDEYVSDILYYTTVSTIENSLCAKYYGSSVVLPGVICANGGTPHTSPCQGDSGAPVVVMDSCGKPVQVGVFSFVNGYGCELPYPSGNSRVSYYREWIRGKTGI